MRDRYHHGELRQAMVDAAIEELAEHGEKVLSVRSLADRVGVSHAAPYHHFGTRDGLLASIAEEGFRRAHDVLRQVSGHEPRQQLIELGVAYVGFGSQHPALFQLMFGHGLRYRDRHDGLREAKGSFWQLLLDAVSKLASSDPADARHSSVERVACSLWAHAHGLSALLGSRDWWSLDAVEWSAGDASWVRDSLDAIVRGCQIQSTERLEGDIGI